MRESEFESYLLSDEKIKSKKKALRSRMAKARLIERHFDMSLDCIVADDETMYKTLLRIKVEIKDTNGTITNALRKYYVFTNGKLFPVLSEYERQKG